MEAFENLPRDKRERIINAAMDIFATHGYHKASVADIANRAGISKAMIFTYFSSKLGCYEFMCEEMLRVSVQEFYKFQDQIFAETDYFERIILSLKLKMEILKQYPRFLAFAMSMYTERDHEAMPVTKRILAKGYSLRETFLSSGVDSDKFKNPNDAKRVAKIAEWISAGCADQWSRCDSMALDETLSEFVDCIILLKKHFYKEEYI